MPSPPRDFTHREVMKVLFKAGFRYANPDSGGSHVVMTKEDHDGNSSNVTLVADGGRIAEGTLRSIAAQAGAEDFDAFCEWLDNNR